MSVLDSLEAEANERLISEIAAEASLAIRTYLAGAQAEPALYETIEEFHARQTILPADANHVLNKFLHQGKDTGDLHNTLRSFILGHLKREGKQRLGRCRGGMGAP